MIKPFISLTSFLFLCFPLLYLFSFPVLLSLEDLDRLAPVASFPTTEPGHMLHLAHYQCQ